MNWTDDLRQELMSITDSEALLAFCKKNKLSYEAASRQKRRLKSKTKSVSTEEVADQHTALYYESKIKELSSEVASLRKEIGFQTVIKNVAEAKVIALPKVVAPKPTVKAKKVVNEIGVLLLSDTHIGERVDKDDMGGLNEYNFNIFTKRMKKLAVGITSIKRKMQGYNLEHLEIIALGDMVGNSNIHEELASTSEETLIESIFNGALITSQFILELLTEFKTIRFTGHVGNHGRLSQKVTYKKRYVNYDYIYYLVLALMLRNNPRVTFDLPKSFWSILDVGGVKILALHGDGIKSWSGISWYGIQRTIYKLTDLLNANNKQFSYVCLGHFHNAGSLSRTKGEVLLNGSLIGSNEYSLGSLFASTEPNQLFFGVNPKHSRVTWRFNIDLRDVSGIEGAYSFNHDIL